MMLNSVSLHARVTPMRRQIMTSRRLSIRVSAHSQSFTKIKSEEAFFKAMEVEVNAGRLPKIIMYGWRSFYDSYKSAILTSQQPGRDEAFIAEVMADIADRVLLQFEDSYTFPSFHERILTPFNYFEFGQRYVRSLINYHQSVVGHADRFKQIEAILAKGENVIFLANHQTEADPGVFALLLESWTPKMATDVIYVAGDRVVSDPMCKPFSMGRNLLCVHSKKHMGTDPEIRQAKMNTNRKTLVMTQRLLNEGGKLIWVAPSGGRDRPKEDGTWSPDAFDPSAVGLFFKMGMAAKCKTHLFPMAMVSWKMMPPPTSVEKEIGEKRVTNYTGVGISCCEEMNVPAIVGTLSDPEEQIVALTKAAHQAVVKEYAALDKAIVEGVKSNPSFSQPWAKATAKA